VSEVWPGNLVYQGPKCTMHFAATSTWNHSNSRGEVLTTSELSDHICENLQGHSCYG